MKYKLNIEISFSDKYTNEDYKVGKVYPFDEARAKELLADPRKLVSLNEIIEDEETKKAKVKAETAKKTKEEEEKKTSDKK